MKQILLILSLLLPSAAGAQNDFTQLNWNELRIDSVLPVYTEVVPLETDYRLFDYSVHVRYPEWQPLTAREVLVAERFKDRISDSLMIETFVGTSRGEGLLDISFVPIILRNGRYLKLSSGRVEIQPTPKPLSPRKQVKRQVVQREQRWASKSVLSSGRWVKLSLTDDGIYHITNAQLLSWGFSPQNVKLYGYGGHLQPERIDADTDWDDLEPVSLLQVPDGYLFHANGLLHWNSGTHYVNHYARYAAYFLTDGATEAFPTEKVEATITDATPEVNTFTGYTTYDPDGYSWFQGGRKLFEDYDYISGSTRSYTLSLPTRAADAQGVFRVNFTAGNTSATNVTPSFNGTPLTSFELSALSDYIFATSRLQSYSVNSIKEANTISINATSGMHARLDYLELAYNGLMKIDALLPAIQFSRQLDNETEVFCIEYSNGQSPQLWRLAEPGQPTTQLVGETAVVTDGSGVSHNVLRVPVKNDGQTHNYAVVDVSSYAIYAQPTYVGAIANQNLHALDSLEMVIITPASGIFDAEAERLAQFHREQDGLKVQVVRADQLYNEFSSGTPDATAYRRFMKMLYDRVDDKTEAPRYLLLFGDCAYDNRMITSSWKLYNPDNFLLCFESEESLSDVNCYVMEDYFGMLDDGEGANLTREKVDVGVGRFPVRTVSQARALVDKTINYVRSQQTGAWKNVLCFLGDDGDNNEHLKYADQAAERIAAAHPELEIRKIMWDSYTRVSSTSGNRYPEVQQVIQKQMDEGALMMNYTGHGSPTILSHEQVLRLEVFPTYTTPRPPFWVTCACDVMPFDTQKENIGETAILNETGAAIAFYGTSRTVYATANRQLNLALCDALFDTDSKGRSNRLGDAVRLSKSNITGVGVDNNYRANKIHYALLGDPALQLSNLENRIVLDSINGVPIDQLGEDFALHAGARPRMSGHLETTEGKRLDGFHGTINLRLYDSESTVTCRNNDKSAKEPFQYSTYDKILYNGLDSVVAGKFSMICPIPLDIKYSYESGRLLLYAVSNDLKNEARGYSEDFLLGGTAPNLTDTIGPKVRAYLNDESFINGNVVGCSPYFIAFLEDESGISTSGNGLGHDLELVIDNDASQTYNLNDYYVNEFGNYSRGSLAFSIPSMTEGVHTLTFRAWDMMNNCTITTLSCIVDPQKRVNFFALTASQSPATTSTTFLLSYDRPGSTCTFTIEVFDFMGRQLWEHTESGASAFGMYAIPWNLTTGGGFPLGSGVYLYRARISCDASDEVTKAQKIIINRRQ